ncbi:MAG: hypothetical protein SGBAC_004380 [Bacillariaceae sp.]
MSDYSFKTLKKKIDKVDAMLKELDSSDEKYEKLQSKREKYYDQLKQTPEWETEGAAIERRENLKRQARQLRETANRAENARKVKEREREAEKERKVKEREAKRLERERLETERLERERLEKERLENERSEKERLEREHLEKKRLERDREEQKRREKERLEREREERYRLEREREEQECLEKESLERERQEEERIEREQLEQERLEQKHLEEERIQEERLRQDRLEQEKEEAEKLGQERGDHECLEQARIEQEALAATSIVLVDEPNASTRQGGILADDAEQSSPCSPVGGGPNPVDSTKAELTGSSANVEQAAPRPPPMLGGMGGFLAEIGQRKKKMDATRKPIEEKRVITLRLVDTKTVNAESVESKTADQKELVSPKPQRIESIASSEDAAHRRRPMLGGIGGMLAEIGKKKKKMDATRKPIEEKTVPRLKLLDIKTTDAKSVSPNSSTAVSKPPAPKQSPKYTSRGTGEEKLSEDFLQSRKSTLLLARSANTEIILRELSATEEYHEKLEKHLKRNCIPIPADIPYEVCKDKIESITKQMQNLQASEENPYILEKRYFELEQEMMKYSTAMMLTDEWAEEQQRLGQEWEDLVRADNINALEQVRSHMPVNVRSLTEEALASEPTPNGKVLPQAFARKFKRTNVLQLLRVNPNDIEKMHPSYFEGMRTTGLTLTERRALYEHMKGIAGKWLKLKADKNVERKWRWFDSLKAKFKEMQTAYDLHRDDPQNRHVKADRILDYSVEDYGFPIEAVYESSSSQGKAEASAVSNHETPPQAKPKKKADDAEILAEIRDRLELNDAESEADKKLLRELYHAEKRTRLLEKSLKQAGIEIPEDDIPYAEAKVKVGELTEKIKAVAGNMMSTSDTKEAAMLEKEFGSLSSELTRYQNAMMESKEWALEQQEKERQWEESVREINQNALKMIRRHMPVKIRDMSEEALVKQTTPNGKELPLHIARKFKRTNILLLLRMDPSSIEPMHPSSLESLRTTGLTLTERRGLHEHLRDLGPRWKALSNDKMAERKWMWHESLRLKFKELVNAYNAHVDKYGPEGNPSMGNRCLVKADQAVDYSGDYGFPEDAEFKVDSVAKSTLLTMDDIKKRRQEEEGEEEEEPAKPGGFLAAIGGLRK